MGYGGERPLLDAVTSALRYPHIIPTTREIHSLEGSEVSQVLQSIWQRDSAL